MLGGLSVHAGIKKLKKKRKEKEELWSKKVKVSQSDKVSIVNSRKKDWFLFHYYVYAKKKSIHSNVCWAQKHKSKYIEDMQDGRDTSSLDQAQARFDSTHKEWWKILPIT